MGAYAVTSTGGGGGGGTGVILDGVNATIKATVFSYTNSKPLAVRLTDTNGDYAAAGAGTQYTQDAALTVASTVGTMAMGRASAAAPTNVSADNDAVIPWFLRSGAQAVQLTAGGALIPGDAGNGLSVNIVNSVGLVTSASGDVGSGSADSGNPVKVGGVYRSSPITLANGQRGDLQLDVNGYLKVAPVAGTAVLGHVITDTGSTTAVTGTVATNLTQVGGASIVLGSGGGVAAALPVTYQTDSVGVSAAGAAGSTYGINAMGFDNSVARKIRTNASGFLQVEGNIASGVADSTSNPVKVGGKYNSSPITLTDGQRGDAQLDASGFLKVNVSAGTVAIGAGSAVIGHVIADTGSTTVVTGTVTVAGAAASGAAKAGNPIQGGAVFNTTQPTVTTGQAVENQATARGALIVAPGVDNFAVQATLAAETTKVIGTVNIAAAQTLATVTNLAQLGGAAVPIGAGTEAAAIRVTLPTDGTGKVSAAQSGTWTVQPGNTPNTVPWLVGHGKTLLTKTGSASATFTIVAAVASKKIKVYSLSLMTASTSAVTVTFKDAAAGTAVATYILQAITGTNFGITENVAVPSELFETTAGNLLEMSFGAAVAVTYNLRYWADDAT